MELVPKSPVLAPDSLKLFEKIVKNRRNSSEKNQLFPKLIQTDNKQISYAVKEIEKKPQINFKHLEWLLDVTTNNENKNESHKLFMENYNKIFKNENDDQKNKSKSLVFERLFKNNKDDRQSKVKAEESAPTGADNESNTNRDKPTLSLDTSHDIKHHLQHIHSKISVLEDPYIVRLNSFKRLRKLIKKYPFERSDDENEKICEILMSVPEFIELFPLSLREDKYFLTQVCCYAQLETVSTKETPVFGTTAFYLILKGSVRPLTVPHLNKHFMKIRQLTPEPRGDSLILKIGDCFGTITELVGRDITTRMFRAVTLEEKCEFLKISVESYSKISKKILEEQKMNKYNAIKNCSSYKSWPKQSVEGLMEILEWRNFPANTILTSEGYRCPFIGFIVEGQCHVLRKVDVPHINKKTGLKEKRMKQVVVGKMGKNESFGEISVIYKEPMTCTIVCETACKIGIIPSQKANYLDNLTIRLMLQTVDRTFGNLTLEQIHEKYIEQEKTKEWKEFKSLIVNDIIKKYGISPGKGKYSSPNVDTHFNQ